MIKIIIKADGSQEPFSIQKFRDSLKRTGVQGQLIDEMADQIEKIANIKTTRDVYGFAFNYLRKHSRALAAKYNLKNALMLLGPSGFPFERYIGKLFEELGYHVSYDQIIQGTCVSHEVDVVGSKDNITLMVEAKFHHRYGLKADVQTALYVKARFDDIYQRFHQEHPNKNFTRVLVTNTQFTAEAIAYAECANLNLLGWGYPRHESLEELVTKYKMIPITALTSLDDNQKAALIEKNCVLCRDVQYHQKDLADLALTDYEIKTILDEAHGVSEL